MVHAVVSRLGMVVGVGGGVGVRRGWWGGRVVRLLKNNLEAGPDGSLITTRIQTPNADVRSVRDGAHAEVATISTFLALTPDPTGGLYTSGARASRS